MNDDVQKRIMQVAILLGVLSIPSFASADSGVFGTTIPNTTSVLETVPDGVAKTTPIVEEELPMETVQPVATIVDSVNETTQKVTEAVVNDKPLVVKAGVVEAEVLKTQKVIVDTSSLSLNVERDTELVQTEVSIETPIVNVERNAEQVAGPLVETIQEDKAIDMETRPRPKKGENEFEQIKVIPTLQSGPYIQANSSPSTAGMVMAVLNSLEVDNANGSFSYFGKGRMYYDQWLNAPPSQPPRNSLFTISRT